MADTEVITVLSLCTGYGGLELGLARALENPLRVVAVEVEAYALANLVAKAEAGKLAIEALWPDLRTFPAERFRGCFDFVIAGFPCQPFSVAGKRGGSTDERHLWPDIERIISAVRPVWVWLENVPGLLSARTLDNRPDLCRYLAKLGTVAGIAPTAKKRWYLSEHIRRLTGYLLRTEGIPAYSSVYFSLRDMGFQVEAGLFTAAECGGSIAGERLYVLAAADCLRKLQPQRGKRHERGRPNNGSPPTMATPKGKGYANRRQSRTQTTRPRFANSSSHVRGVAFQEEEQYEWEEPRAVATTNNYRNRRSRPKAEPDSNEQENRISQQNAEHKKAQAQSRLGGAVDGTRNRVDRLRLLGNGVVPQQAEKAFRCLMSLFGDK